MSTKQKFKRFARDESVKQEVLKSFLIVTEGTETEKNYFESFETFSSVEVQVVPAGAETISVVNRAIQEKQKRHKVAKKDNSFVEFDEVWTVFDKDDNSKTRYMNALQKAASNNIHVAYSNECFELWLLLHFKFQDTETGRKDYFKYLDKVFSARFNRPYQKSDPEIYSLLQPFQDTALRNAKKLNDSYSASRSAFDKDPITTVYLLVILLNESGRQHRWQK